MVITKVDPDSDAADKGLQPGDVVLRIGSRTVSTPADVQAGVAEAKRAAARACCCWWLTARAARGFFAVDIGQRDCFGRRRRFPPSAPPAAEPPLLPPARTLFEQEEVSACEFSSSRTIWKPNAIWCRG